MGVWQVTNETQPYVGQWDAITDTLCNGKDWVPFSVFDITAPAFERWACVPISSEFTLTPYAVQPVITSMSQAEAIKHWEKETQPQAQDPWEALKSMF